MSAKYEIKQAKDGKFYFNLKASNGQVILTSQIYKDKGGAKKRHCVSPTELFRQ